MAESVARRATAAALSRAARRNRQQDQRAMAGVVAGTVMPFVLIPGILCLPEGDAWGVLGQIAQLGVAGAVAVFAMAPDPLVVSGLVLEAGRASLPGRWASWSATAQRASPFVRFAPIELIPTLALMLLGLAVSWGYVAALGAGLQELFPWLDALPEDAGEHGPGLGGPGLGGQEFWEQLPMLLSVLVVAPLGEEWLCRGVIWRGAERIAGAKGALAVSSFVFGFLHVLNGLLILELPHRWVMGLLYGWLRLRTGSLWPGVLAHALHNTCAVLLV